MLLPLPAAGQEAPARPPLREAEVVQLLHAHVSKARLLSLVRKFGIDFPLGPSIDVLRAAGADAALIEELKAAAPAGPQPPRRPAASTSSARSPAAATATLPPHPLEPDLALVRGGAKGDVSLARREVTNREYLAYCARAGRPRPEAPFWGTPADFPVVNVTWYDAVTYCRWLSLETGRGYRLATEAEWELAARAGALQRTYPWGEDDPVGRACFGKGSLCPVGSFKPNALGLFDMAGSVAEWVQNPFAKDGERRVVKGGSWATPLENPLLVAIARRERADARKGRNEIGFRVAREP